MSKVTISLKTWEKRSVKEFLLYVLVVCVEFLSKSKVNNTTKVNFPFGSLIEWIVQQYVRIYTCNKNRNV